MKNVIRNFWLSGFARFLSLWQESSISRDTRSFFQSVSFSKSQNSFLKYKNFFKQHFLKKKKDFFRVIFLNFSSSESSLLKYKQFLLRGSISWDIRKAFNIRKFHFQRHQKFFSQWVLFISLTQKVPSRNIIFLQKLFFEKI